MPKRDLHGSLFCIGNDGALAGKIPKTSCKVTAAEVLDAVV